MTTEALKAWCENCKEQTGHHLDHERDTQTCEPYTDFMCSKCYCISLSAGGWLNVNKEKS